MNESKFDMQYSHYHFESAAFTIVYEVVKNNRMTNYLVKFFELKAYILTENYKMNPFIKRLFYTKI